MISQRKFLLVFLLFLTICESGCYFFRKRSLVDDDDEGRGVVGQSLGPRAGGVDEAALALVHNTHTPYLPAAIRPDPDLLVRQLLLQYREEGPVVAREIGRVENFRILLGGANVDFTIAPQENYDATSLLAKLKVASEVCEGLVAPNQNQHPGWESILPYDAESAESNIRFLIQRITGVPSYRISDEMVESLFQILDSAREEGRYSYKSYIPVCATLVVDAGALLL